MKRFILAMVLVLSWFMMVDSPILSAESRVGLVNSPLTGDERAWFPGASKFGFDVPDSVGIVHVKATVEAYEDGKLSPISSTETYVYKKDNFVVRVTPMSVGNPSYDLLQHFGVYMPIKATTIMGTTNVWLPASSQPLQVNKDFVLAVGLYGLRGAFETDGFIPQNEQKLMSLLKRASAGYVIRCRVIDVK